MAAKREHLKNILRARIQDVDNEYNDIVKYVTDIRNEAISAAESVLSTDGPEFYERRIEVNSVIERCFNLLVDVSRVIPEAPVTSKSVPEDSGRTPATSKSTIAEALVSIPESATSSQRCDIKLEPLENRVKTEDIFSGEEICDRIVAQYRSYSLNFLPACSSESTECELATAGARNESPEIEAATAGTTSNESTESEFATAGASTESTESELATTGASNESTESELSTVDTTSKSTESVLANAGTSNESTESELTTAGTTTNEKAESDLATASAHEIDQAVSVNRALTEVSCVPMMKDTGRISSENASIQLQTCELYSGIPESDNINNVITVIGCENSETESIDITDNESREIYSRTYAATTRASLATACDISSSSREIELPEIKFKNDNCKAYNANGKGEKFANACDEEQVLAEAVVVTVNLSIEEQEQIAENTNGEEHNMLFMAVKAVNELRANACVEEYKLEENISGESEKEEVEMSVVEEEEELEDGELEENTSDEDQDGFAENTPFEEGEEKEVVSITDKIKLKRRTSESLRKTVNSAGSMPCNTETPGHKITNVVNSNSSHVKSLTVESVDTIVEQLTVVPTPLTEKSGTKILKPITEESVKKIAKTLTKEPTTQAVQETGAKPSYDGDQNTILLHCIRKCLIKKLINHDCAEPFCDSGYVEKHWLEEDMELMNFRTVEMRLKEKTYGSAKECIRDINTIFKNCYWYNKSDSKIVKKGKALEEYFSKMVSGLESHEHDLLNESSDEESVPIIEGTAGSHETPKPSTSAASVIKTRQASCLPTHEPDLSESSHEESVTNIEGRAGSTSTHVTSKPSTSAAPLVAKNEHEPSKDDNNNYTRSSRNRRRAGGKEKRAIDKKMSWSSESESSSESYSTSGSGSCSDSSTKSGSSTSRSSSITSQNILKKAALKNDKERSSTSESKKDKECSLTSESSTSRSSSISSQSPSTSNNANCLKAGVAASAISQLRAVELSTSDLGTAEKNGSKDTKTESASRMSTVVQPSGSSFRMTVKRHFDRNLTESELEEREPEKKRRHCNNSWNSNGSPYPVCEEEQHRRSFPLQRPPSPRYISTSPLSIRGYLSPPRGDGNTPPSIRGYLSPPPGDGTTSWGIVDVRDRSGNNRRQKSDADYRHQFWDEWGKKSNGPPFRQSIAGRAELHGERNQSESKPFQPFNEPPPPYQSGERR